MAYGCHNHEPRRRPASLRVQDGWTTDGRRVMVQIAVTSSTQCKYDLNRTDPRCAGCRWSMRVVS